MRPERAPSNPWELSAMEYEVLRLITEDHDRHMTAAVLEISVKTVDTHLTRAKDKMQVQTTSRAAVLFDRQTRVGVPDYKVLVQCENGVVTAQVLPA